MPRRSRREQPDLEEAPRLEKRSDAFSKTKMCKFHILGICTRGESCQFAHDRVELNALPDLFRTKLCKRLINTGSCDDPNCKYAHNKEELREHPVPRVDRSVRIGGHAREDPPTHAGNSRTAAVAKAATRRGAMQDMPPQVASHERQGQMVGRYGGSQQTTMGADVGGGPNQTWLQQVAQNQEFCAPSSSSFQKKKYPGEWDQFSANQKLFGIASHLSQYSTQSVRAPEASNMGYSPERWPQNNLQLGSGGDCDKGNNGGRSCSSDTDTKSGFGSDNSSVTQPPDHLLAGDQFRVEHEFCPKDYSARMIQAFGHSTVDQRFQNGQMMTMTMIPSMVQEAEVAAGLPYVPCNNVPMNNINCYNAKMETMHGGCYPMGTQPPTHVLGLAEMLGAEDCSVKNTFLNFASSTPKLRNVQTAAGRLDLMAQE
mmetsp:Transcript_84331/g.132852  ORF Transcript_84331/g.132852 Transcript_84331/m.132852 type:complete len:427 (+) Transcript_84331:70-1350(+)